MKHLYNTFLFNYRDPRWKRMAQAEEEKANTRDGKRDGAKLSFKEKMLLFAAEAGEKTPRDKAKISKAQRNIEGDENQENYTGSESSRDGSSP